MNKTIEIQTPSGIQTISNDKLFIIAEVGNQFNGNLDTAKELARVAKEAGADAVKFIFWFPDEIMADKTLLYTYKTANGEKTEPMFDLLDRLRLPVYDWATVKTYCDKIGIMMFSTITCPSAFEMAMGLGLPMMKLSSWSHNFTDMWEWCANVHLPCLADLGPVYEGELERNVNIFLKERNKNLMLMYCFHTNNEAQFNMLSIPYVADKFNCLVGYASADANDDTDIMAVSLGACLLEKRITLDRRGGVLHDAVSKEPEEFKKYVTRMRSIKTMLGEQELQPSDGDLAARKKWFRRIVADTDIGWGDIITRGMLEAKRGEDTGISPTRIWEFVGKTAKRNIKRNEDIRSTDV